MTQAENNENRLESLRDLIWTNYVQVFMDIVYASMLVDKLRNKQTNWFFWGIYICLGCPSILSILVKKEIVTSGWFIYPICAIILLVPIILKWKNKSIVYSALGIHDKKINGLLSNNEKLEQFKDDLLLLYFDAENVNPTTTNVTQIETKYKNIKMHYQDYISKFCDLAGEVDIALQEIAENKTDMMIKATTFYGTEETTD